MSPRLPPSAETRRLFLLPVVNVGTVPDVTARSLGLDPRHRLAPFSRRFRLPGFAGYVPHPVRPDPTLACIARGDESRMRRPCRMFLETWADGQTVRNTKAHERFIADSPPRALLQERGDVHLL